MFVFQDVRISVNSTSSFDGAGGAVVPGFLLFRSQFIHEFDGDKD